MRFFILDTPLFFNCLARMEQAKKLPLRPSCVPKSNADRASTEAQTAIDILQLFARRELWPTT